MTVAEGARAKLSPDALSVSPRFTAILGFLVGERWTDPAITEMVETVDGFLLAANTVDPFLDDFVGHVSDLDRNLDGVANAVGLTRRERAWLQMQRVAKIRRA